MATAAKLSAADRRAMAGGGENFLGGEVGDRDALGAKTGLRARSNSYHDDHRFEEAAIDNATKPFQF